MKAITIIVAIMLIIAGCHAVATNDTNSTHFSDTIQMHQSAEATRDDVLRFVPLKMPVDDAVRTLEERGFKRIPHGRHFDMTAQVPAGVNDPNWLIFEKRFRPEDPMPTLEIRILPENGKVKEVEAETVSMAVL